MSILTKIDKIINSDNFMQNDQLYILVYTRSQDSLNHHFPPYLKYPNFTVQYTSKPNAPATQNWRFVNFTKIIKIWHKSWKFRSGIFRTCQLLSRIQLTSGNSLPQTQNDRKIDYFWSIPNVKNPRKKLKNFRKSQNFGNSLITFSKLPKRPCRIAALIVKFTK